MGHKSCHARLVCSGWHSRDVWRSGNDKLASVDLHMCHEHNDIMTGCLTIDCLRSFCLVKSRGFAHLAAQDLVSMMLHYIVRDCQNCRSSRPYRDAQDRLLWRDKACPART